MSHSIKWDSQWCVSHFLCFQVLGINWWFQWVETKFSSLRDIRKTLRFCSRIMVYAQSLLCGCLWSKYVFVIIIYTMLLYCIFICILWCLVVYCDSGNIIEIYCLLMRAIILLILFNYILLHDFCYLYYF